jgi:hypothetical protein
MNGRKTMKIFSPPDAAEHATNTGPKKPKKPLKPTKPVSGQEAKFRLDYGSNCAKIRAAINSYFKNGAPRIGRIGVEEHPELFLGDNAPLAVDIDPNSGAVYVTARDDSYHKNLVKYKEKVAKYIEDEMSYKKQLLEYEQFQAQRRLARASQELEKINRELKKSSHAEKASTEYK